MNKCKLNMYKLEKWYKQFENYKQISFDEAKNEYIKALDITDEDERNALINEIVMQTLYKVYKYLKKNDINIFMHSSFNMDDIISAFTEQWILSIKSGMLLNVNSFSKIIYSIVHNFTIYDYEDFANNYPFSKDEFVNYFIQYMELRNENGNISFNEFINFIGFDRLFAMEKDVCDRSVYIYNCQKSNNDRFVIITMFEVFNMLYNRLKSNDDDNLRLGVTKIQNYSRLLEEMGFFERINNKISSGYNLDDDVVNNIFLNKLREVIDEKLMDREKDVLYRKFGFDGREEETIASIAKSYGVSETRIGQIEERAKVKLKRSSKIRNFARTNNIDL